MKKGHSYPTSFGFTNSSGKVHTVKPHTRANPARVSKAPPVPPIGKPKPPKC